MHYKSEFAALHKIRDYPYFAPAGTSCPTSICRTRDWTRQLSWRQFFIYKNIFAEWYCQRRYKYTFQRPRFSSSKDRLLLTYISYPLITSFTFKRGTKGKNTGTHGFSDIFRKTLNINHLLIRGSC